MTYFKKINSMRDPVKEAFEENSIREALRAIIDSGKPITIRDRHKYTNGVLLATNQVPGFDDHDALFVYNPKPTQYPHCCKTIYHIPFGANNVERFRKDGDGLTIIVNTHRIPQIFPRDHDDYQEFLKLLE